MRYGFYGKLLHVDLTAGTTDVMEVSKADVARYYLES